jgi:hypothetical protein
MTETDPKKRAQYLRGRAAEVRTAASATQDAGSRMSMLRIADAYDKAAGQIDPL